MNDRAAQRRREAQEKDAERARVWIRDKRERENADDPFVASRLLLQQQQEWQEQAQKQAQEKNREEQRVYRRKQREREKVANAEAKEKARKLEEQQRRDGVVEIQPMDFHPLYHPQGRDTGNEDMLFLGASFTDIRDVARTECKLPWDVASALQKTIAIREIADLVNTTNMEMVHARDTARAVALERMAKANVYTCNDFYTSQSWLRKDRHVAGDWNQSSDRGVACKMKRMAIRFGKVFMDYIYLPGSSYTTLRYAKEGFFKFTLPAIQDRLMHKRTNNGRLPAIFLPATKHILASLCCIVDIKADTHFSYTLMNEEQARQEHLLYKATIEMDVSDVEYRDLFGKVKTELQRCEYDTDFKGMLKKNNLGKSRLEQICGCSDENQLKKAVNGANFIKIERLSYASEDGSVVTL